MSHNIFSILDWLQAKDKVKYRVTTSTVSTRNETDDYKSKTTSSYHASCLLVAPLVYLANLTVI